MIKTIHLLHHTHTDFGYTDHPVIAQRLFRRYTGEALELIQSHRTDSDEAAQFRWTIEVAEVAVQFWQSASPAERQQMRDLAHAGLLDMGALPFHPHGFSGLSEWKAIQRRLKPVYEVFQPKTAILNDVNGLAWGLIPQLLDAGVQYFSSGLNVGGGRAPVGINRPSLFRWQGPDDRWIWAWNGLHYCDGYFFFHRADWRRGPIPVAHDLFFHPPIAGDVWPTDPQGLADCRAIYQETQARLLADYPHENVGLQVTNLWRMDNDPPSDLLCKFVAAWNAAGFAPRLRISTFTQFFDAVTAEASSGETPLIRGDWVNYWADGAAAMPRESRAAARAVQILSDIPRLAGAWSSGEPGEAELVESAWQKVSLFNEHTSDSHDSVSDASGDLSQGGKAYKSSLAYEALAEAELALSDRVRSSRAYTPGRHADAIAVVNPGKRSQSGWINIPLAAVPDATESLIDLQTGEVLPVHIEHQAVWSPPTLNSRIEFDRPHKTFGSHPRQLRAFIHGVAPGSQRLFRLAKKTPATEIPDAGWRWDWDLATGTLRRLHRQHDQHQWLSPTELAPRFGSVLFDTYPEIGARWGLVFGDRNHPPQSVRRERSFAVVESCDSTACSDFDQVDLRLRHPNCHRIKQRWYRYRHLPRIEIETTLWLREVLEPLAAAMVFPFAACEFDIHYSSIGHPTRVGRDQMPGTCGAYTLTEGAVGLTSQEGIILSSPGLGLMAFGELDIFSAASTAPPSQPTIFNLFASTRWMTNFPHLRPVRLRLRHRIDATSAQEAQEVLVDPATLYTVPVTVAWAKTLLKGEQ